MKDQNNGGTKCPFCLQLAAAGHGPRCGYVGLWCWRTVVFTHPDALPDPAGATADVFTVRLRLVAGVEYFTIAVDWKYDACAAVSEFYRPTYTPEYGAYDLGDVWAELETEYTELPAVIICTDGRRDHLSCALEVLNAAAAHRHLAAIAALLVPAPARYRAVYGGVS